MDSTTFGKFPSAKNLASILDGLNDPKVTWYASKTINKAYEITNTIKLSPKVKGPNGGRSLGDCIYKDIRSSFVNKINETSRLDNYPKVRTHLRTTVVSILKSMLTPVK